MEKTKRLSTLAKKAAGMADLTLSETGSFPELLGVLKHRLRLLHIVKNPFSEFSETRERTVGMAIAIQTRHKLTQQEKNWVKKFVANGGIYLAVNTVKDLEEELAAIEEQLKGVTV